MPYGRETGRLDPALPETERTIEFDQVWSSLIRPAIPPEWEAKRADELHAPGLIDQLYTEWLLEADVVVADLTFANPNVYYELGIRQALSRKSTVLVAQKDTALPFDVRNQAVVHYDYFHAPSVQRFLEALKGALTAAAASPRGSPVHTFLPGLHIARYARGRLPDEEIAELRAEIERLRASATIEQGTAAQFERRLALRSALTDLLSRIIRAQLDNAKLLKEHAGDAAYVQMVSSTLNQENAFLLSEATMLLEQIPDFVGAVEYNTVAYALANAGEMHRAESYYRRAVEVARSPVERAMAQRSFGTFLFAQRRFGEARALFRAALTQIPAGDPVAPQFNGYTLQSLAWNEAFVAQETAEADRLFALAEREFTAVENPMLRAQLLGALAAARRGLSPARPTATHGPSSTHAPTGAADPMSGLRDWWNKTTS
jgi:tetratricopeptide (TPR) repeat protein